MNGTLANAHLVSISHDPLEEETNSAGSPAPQAVHLQAARDLRPDLMRPLLLAGALGLLAAWVVTGNGGRRRMAGQRSPAPSRRPRAQPSRPREGHAGPQGSSSEAELQLDALNP